MSSSPGKHKSSSSHHHHHHHHREHHHSSSSSGHSSSSSTKLMPNLPSYIKIQENSKLLPRYSVALSKPHDECLPMDELDGIQMELETLLSSVALRYRALKAEYDSLEDRKHHQKKTVDKEKEKASSPSISGGKRKREEKKSSSSTSKDARRYSQHAKHSKLKSNSSPAHSHYTDHAVPYPNTSAGHSHTNPKPILLKNDVPYKFWLSVEPYCIPITQEDIKMLDDLIDDYSEPLVPSVPELGPHYSIRWASEDLRDEQDATNVNAKSSKRSNSTSADVSESPKKGSEKEKEKDKEKEKIREKEKEREKQKDKEKTEKDTDKEKVMGQGICGPLTQRLVSAMLEDSTEMQSDVVGCSDATGPDGSESCNENNPSSANQTQSSSSIASLLKGGIDVENRLKKELLDLGILEASDFEKDKEDEVLSEINRVRTELQAIAQYNRNELKLLRTAAKAEMKRLEIKRKIDRIDKEIIEAHKRVLAAKQKRRPLTKNERTEIFRLVEEQKRLSDQLEAMPIPGFNYTVGTTDAKSSSKTETASNTTKA